MTDGDIKALRRLAVAEHGLPPQAAGFLSGATLVELDESAAALANLLGEHGDQEERTTARPGPFTDMAAEKARRKRELAAIFTGREPRPRDRYGRFAVFHRGARQSAPPTPESHETTLTRLLRTGEANVGGRGF